MSDFKTSLDEYTREEKEATGNMVYGGKRHDEICDYLQATFNFSEEQINDISMGVWMGIESERRVSESTMAKLQHQVKRLTGALKEASEIFLDIARFGLTNYDTKDCRKLGNQIKDFIETED